MFAIVLLLICIICSTVALIPTSKLASIAKVSATKLYENFNLDFKNFKPESDIQIFSEKQLREYTAQYSVDERINPIQAFLGLFKKDESSSESESTLKAKSGLESKLKKSVSLSVLEEKTALYLKGKTDAKSFYNVLTAAFGSKLPTVLPEILSNLPKDKAAALQKLAK